MTNQLEYEIVSLPEKQIVGIAAQTSNTAPDMQQVIGSMWSKFYSEGIYEAIPGKTDAKALGIYTDYAGDNYTALVACAVDGSGNAPQDTVRRTIPAGKYAKFIVHGDMVTAVSAFWQQLWAMELPRAFTYDYEEYQSDEMENAEIHMYISLK